MPELFTELYNGTCTACNKQYKGDIYFLLIEDNTTNNKFCYNCVYYDRNKIMLNFYSYWPDVETVREHIFNSIIVSKYKNYFEKFPDKYKVIFKKFIDPALNKPSKYHLY